MPTDRPWALSSRSDARTYCCWYSATPKLGPSTSGVYFYLVPVITAGLAFLFLGEIVAWYHFAGGAVIIAGVWLAGRAARPR